MKYLSLIISFFLLSGCKVEKIPDKFEKIKVTYTYNKKYGKYKKFKMRYILLSTNTTYNIQGKKCRRMSNIRVGSYYTANISKTGCSFVESLK